MNVPFVFTLCALSKTKECNNDNVIEFKVGIDQSCGWICARIFLHSGNGVDESNMADVRQRKQSSSDDEGSHAGKFRKLVDFGENALRRVEKRCESCAPPARTTMNRQVITCSQLCVGDESRARTVTYVVRFLRPVVVVEEKENKNQRKVSDQENRNFDMHYQVGKTIDEKVT